MYVGMYVHILTCCAFPWQRLAPVAGWWLLQLEPTRKWAARIPAKAWSFGFLRECIGSMRRPVVPRAAIGRQSSLQSLPFGRGQTGWLEKPAAVQNPERLPFCRRPTVAHHEMNPWLKP